MDELKNILNLFSNASHNEEDPTNLEIGGQGHLEAPVTNQLAFYLDPEGAHGFNDLVLMALLETIEIKGGLELECSPILEQATADKKRIDLILIGTEWVIAFELKVRSKVANPLEEYDKYLEDNFNNGPDKKEIHRYILAPNEIPVTYKNHYFNNSEFEWKALTYTQISKAVKKRHTLQNSGNRYTKWDFFLTDYLNHIGKLHRATEMNEADFKYTHDNISALYKLEMIKKDFIKDLTTKMELRFKEAYPEQVFNFSREKWKCGPAFRISSDQWKGDNGLIIETGFISDESTNATVHIHVNEADQRKVFQLFSDRVQVSKVARPNDKVVWYRHTDGFDCIISAIDESIKHAGVLNDCRHLMIS